MKYPLLLILLTLNFSGSALGSEEREAKVFHCGKDGRQLQDAPCPEAPGKSASAVHYDRPGADETLAARERVRLDAQRGAALEQQRLAEEERARQASARAGNLGAAATAAGPTQPTSNADRKAHKPRKTHAPRMSAHPPAKASSR